jgi:hypothetical protein
MPNPSQQSNDLDFQNINKAIGLPPATANGEAVVFEQLNAALEGISWKDNARVGTQANLSLATPGAAIDGITMVLNDRVLVRLQTSQPENGIYIFNGAASPMTRSNDASTFDELESAIVTVDEGTSAGNTFRQTQVNLVIGTGNVIWSNFIAAAPAASETVAGVSQVATQAETDAGLIDTDFVSPLKLKTSPFAHKGFNVDFGDGTATLFTLNHNLNSLDINVRVYNKSTNRDVGCLVTRINVNTVQINASPAFPAAGARLTVIKV